MSDETLQQILGVEPARKAVIEQCAVLVDNEVKRKSGMSGIALKGAYGTVKKIKPGFVVAAVDGLLDGWLEKLEPHHRAWRQVDQGAFSEFIATRTDAVAEALLSVTDERAQTSKHKTAAKLYMKLRPSAKRNVEEAVPELGRLIDPHLKR